MWMMGCWGTTVELLESGQHKGNISVHCGAGDVPGMVCGSHEVLVLAILRGTQLHVELRMWRRSFYSD